MDYMTLKEASEKWGVSSRQVNYYCVEGRIPGAVKMAGVWLTPKETDKPADRRYKKQVKTKMKILLVEDDLEISKLLAEFLQENGYEVFCQYDGLHVLDCLRENNIDLILLDIMLPYRNGDTVLTAVR